MVIINLSLKLNASSFSARKAKGLIYLDMKDYRQSASYFKEQSTKQPKENVWLYYYSESLYKQDLLDSAMSVALIMQNTVDREKYWRNYESCLLLQAEIVYKKNHFSKALELLDQIRFDFKDNAEFCYYYGLSNLNVVENPNKRKAKKYIERAIDKGYDVDKELIDKLQIKIRQK